MPCATAGSGQASFATGKRNGELYWEMAYISPVTGADGVITHYVAVKEDITERKRTEEQLRELSLSDELTGLVNRRGFMVLARQQIKVSDRSGRALALVFIDMDGLKRINDTMGHGEGDRAICDAAAVLKRSFRASDIVARIGGDEFVALSVEANEQTEAHIVERLQENINAFNLENGWPYKLAMSYGVTLYDPHAACTLEELLERGDRLMYQQKQAKKAAREA
jgi:diguanylate cyclase (GGDEF)-like protein